MTNIIKYPLQKNNLTRGKLIRDDDIVDAEIIEEPPKRQNPEFNNPQPKFNDPTPTPIPKKPVEYPKKRYNVSNTINNVGESVFGGETAGNGLTFFFIIATLAHLFDAITDFQRPGFMLFVYMFLAIYAFVFLFKMHISSSDEIALFAIIIVSYVLPYLQEIFTGGLYQTYSGMVLLFPILPLYIGMKFPESTFIAKMSRIYLVFWMIILAFTLMLNLNPDQLPEAKISNPFDGLRHIISALGKTGSGLATSFTTTIQNAIADVTGQPNPGDQESTVGIFVEDVKTIESKYTTDSNVYVEAKIVAKNVKEPVNVHTSCLIDNVNSGITTPSILEEIEGNYENIISCELGKLPKGSYRVVVTALFEFETTSDITYTFVDQNIRTDKLNSLNIDSEAIATYTGGPVALGLSSITQPLRIDSTRPDGGKDNYPFGVSLENKWTNGKITRGLKYILSTPKEIKLDTCNRPVVSERYNEKSKMNEYVFEINKSKVQESFDGIQCRIKFVDATKLLGNNIKTVKTFAARARYEYIVEGSTSVYIEEVK